MPSPTTSASHAAMPEDTWFDVLKATPGDAGRLAACLAAGGSPRRSRRGNDGVGWDVGGSSLSSEADAMVMDCLNGGRVAMAAVLFDHGAGRRARGLNKAVVDRLHRVAGHGPTGDPAKAARDGVAGDDPDLTRVLVGMGADPVAGCRAAAAAGMPRCVAAWLGAVPDHTRAAMPMDEMLASSADLSPSIERCLAAGGGTTYASSVPTVAGGWHPAHLLLMARAAPLAASDHVMGSAAMAADETTALAAIALMRGRGASIRGMHALMAMGAKHARTALALIDAMPDPCAVDATVTQVVAMIHGGRDDARDPFRLAGFVADPSLDPRLRFVAWAWGTATRSINSQPPDLGPHAAWAIEQASRHMHDAWGMRLLAACSRGDA